jgi:hypothetical protein
MIGGRTVARIPSPGALRRHPLVTRVRADTVTFGRPFFLQKINRELPAGSYAIETDEESLEDISTLAFRRVGVRLFVPRIAGRSEDEMWTIRPQDFDSVLANDRGPAGPETATRALSSPEATGPQPGWAAAATALKAGAGDFAQRKADFEKTRDDELSKRGMRSNGPLYGVCLGILALLAATWLAHEFDTAGADAPAVQTSAAS